MHKKSTRIVDSTFLLSPAGRLDARPARNIVTRRGKHSRGYFPSLKSSAPLRYESQLELSAYRLLEVSSLSRRVGAQPANLRLADRAQAFRYTPDLFFTTSWRETIVAEVKPDRKFLEPDITRRLRAVTEEFVEIGMMFVILLESDVKPGQQFQDVLERLLQRRPWRKPTPPGAEQDPYSDHEIDTYSDVEWRSARSICDEVLTRVMSRSFSETVAAAAAAASAEG